LKAKVPTPYLGEKTVSSRNVLGKLDVCIQKIKLGLYFLPHTIPMDKRLKCEK
jgi:hypothetical protein